MTIFTVFFSTRAWPQNLRFCWWRFSHGWAGKSILVPVPAGRHFSSFFFGLILDPPPPGYILHFYSEKGKFVGTTHFFPLHGLCRKGGGVVLVYVFLFTVGGGISDLVGPIRANRFADSRASPDSRESFQGSWTTPLLCESRFGGLIVKIANRRFEAIRANRWTLWN